MGSGQWAAQQQAGSGQWAQQQAGSGQWVAQQAGGSGEPPPPPPDPQATAAYQQRLWQSSGRGY